MTRVIRFVAAAALAAAGAWAADLAAKTGPDVTSPREREATDSELELKWDSNYGKWLMIWYTGAGSWVGNDFDIATLKTYSCIKRLRISTVSHWPNRRWDGFRVGVFAFSGGVPGSMMWPTAGGGYFFKPYLPKIWTEIPVGWVLPYGHTKFAAAMEQFYDYPNCDPYIVDDNPTFIGHSWQRQGAGWDLLVGYVGYRNLMLRVVVANEAVVVAPTSVGRVKALYY